MSCGLADFFALALAEALEAGFVFVLGAFGAGTTKAVLQASQRALHPAKEAATEKRTPQWGHEITYLGSVEAIEARSHPC
ncbi:MAG TPA: hypothetical protein VHU84_00920 [Lacipirellulaceae bacterium]|jgi:hypothetical protein|nr:hypothetical protein [Lacipirellulaceae bacterium]